MDNLDNKSAAKNPFELLSNNNFNFEQFSVFNNDSLEKNEDENENENIQEDKIRHNKRIWKPRPYQQQIYEKALTQNSIIFVETGKGKTFISIMLMANHLGIDINKPENKIKINEEKKLYFLYAIQL